MASSEARNILKLVRDLRRRKARERRDLVLLEGRRLVADARQAGATIEGVLLADDVAEGAAVAAGLAVQTVTRRDFDAAADTDTPSGVLAVARWEPRTLASLGRPARGSVLLVLDAVQDPGNVGTMIRTAHALGALASVALDGTADVRGPKVLRAAMGSHFRHAVVEASFDELVAWSGTAGARVLLAAADGGPVPAARDVEGSALLVVGSEARGPRGGWASLPHTRVAVPMRGDAESLNAAVAAGILLFELLRDVR